MNKQASFILFYLHFHVDGYFHTTFKPKHNPAMNTAQQNRQ